MRRDIFQAIADPIRRDIIRLLAAETLTVNAIAEHFDISRPAVSKHIKILEECGVVAIHKKGRFPTTFKPHIALLFAIGFGRVYHFKSKLDQFESYIMDLKNKSKDN